MEQSARTAILCRIRQALQRPAAEPSWAAVPLSEAPLFALPPGTPEGLKQNFHAEFLAIQGEWLEANSMAEATALLACLFQEQKFRSCLAVEHPLLRRVLGDYQPMTWADSSAPGRAGWENLDLGITPAESLVAESGTIVVSTALSGRAPSVLPPVHLVVATTDQLVPDLETSIARLRERYGAQLPSSLTWISGPSRTADIEKILVLGAHGPKRLLLLMLPADA